MQFVPLVGSQVAAVEGHPLGQAIDGPSEGRHGTGQCRIPFRSPADLVKLLLGGVKVGEGQLHLDHPEVVQGIGRSGHVTVSESPEDEHNGVDLADAGQKSVTQPLALGGPLNQAADIGELHAGRYNPAGSAHGGQAFQTVIGDPGHANIGVSRSEGIRRGEGSPAGQGVIKRGLARVGQAHEPETLHLSALLSWESARPSSAPGPTGQARTTDLAVHGDVTGARRPP